MTHSLPQYPKLRPVEVTPIVRNGRKVLAVHDPTRLSEGAVVVTKDLAYVLQLMDGQHSLLDIRAAYLRTFGTFLFEEQLANLVRALDEHLLLDNERFAAYRQCVEAEFRNAPVRESAHAGQSYPAQPAELRQLLQGYCEAGILADLPFAPEMLKGCVVPHIDLRAGGPSYGSAYRLLAAAGPIDLFVVLGTCHLPPASPSAVCRHKQRFPHPAGGGSYGWRVYARAGVSVG